MQLAPFKWPLDQRQWEQVYRKITEALGLVWVQIDKTGSNLTDLTNRNHADLQNINTDVYTHLSAANHTDLTGGGDSTLHHHVADRARADHTGEQVIATVTGLQTALDGKLDENAAITSATKTKITYDAKGLVTAGTDATTADIADSTNKRYVTDAYLTVLSNTSNTNTGDQDLSGYAVINGDDTETFSALTFTTSDIGATAAEPWRLGTVKSGVALVMLTTSYVEVEINGSVVKLAIIV